MFLSFKSFILLIYEQEMEPMFGKKSPTLKDDHPRHVTNFPAGCIKTGKAAAALLMQSLVLSKGFGQKTFGQNREVESTNFSKV
jgi:hypothetical protein